VLGWFEEWQAAGEVDRVWPRLEHVHRDIKFMVLDEIARRKTVHLAPLLRAWFQHEVRKVRQAINHTLRALDQPALSHPRDRGRPGR